MSSEYIEQLRELDREADERMEEREKKRMLMEAEIEKERRDAEHTHQMEMQRMWMTFFDKMLHSGPPVHQSWPSHPRTTQVAWNCVTHSATHHFSGSTKEIAF